LPITFTKKHVGSMAEVLDGDYETVEEAAKAALEAALDIIKDRARFTVVAQIDAKPGEEPGDKIALRWHATEKQAIEDALKTAYSTQTHEEAHAWVLPIFNDSPSAYYSSRKKDRKAAELENSSYRERELQRRVQWVEDHPDEPLPLDWTVFVATQSQTTECETCKGMGRIPDEAIKRRADNEKGATA
jgi:hypothetical protein